MRHEGCCQQAKHSPSSLTLLQYFAKILIVASAVPPAIPELVLALPDAQPGSFGHLTDDLWLSLAQIGLLPSQALRLPANAVGVHYQRTAHRPGKVEKCQRKKESVGITIASSRFSLLVSSTC